MSTLECNICTEFHTTDVVNATFVVTECEHLFHKHCIINHSSTSSKLRKCPICCCSIKISKLRQIRGLDPNKSPKRFVIATLGDSGVGKTGLVNRFVNGIFERNEVSTIGADFRNVHIKVGDEPIKLFIQDCGGNFMFKAITPQYIRNAHGIIIAYDCTRWETLDDVRGWLDFANQHAPAAEKILIGCRSDLESCTCYRHSGNFVANDEISDGCRKPTEDEIENLASSLGLFHITTSALTSNNVDIAFRTLASQILQNGYLMKNVRNTANGGSMGGNFNSGSVIKLHEPPPTSPSSQNKTDANPNLGFGWCGLRQLFKAFCKSNVNENERVKKI